MYPPLDVRLLEARTSALVFSVGQLGLLTQNMCGNIKQLNWIDDDLEELDSLLAQLRKSVQELEENSNSNF